jgi:hypothetical protein|uniref:Uncharacterized protein n=1 Tax=viral metagenome TaxID=1070528 RepID=A0A6C0CDU9_9ZZZZ
MTAATATTATTAATAKTTIQYFPSLLSYTKRINISRNKRTINIADFIYEWKSEDDADDYFYLRKGDGYSKLNYNIIIYLLLNHQHLFLNNITKPQLLAYIRDNIFYHPNNKINEYEDYIKANAIDIFTFVLEQFKNIQILYNSLATKLPPFSAVLEASQFASRRRREKLVLYRGFNYPRYKKMLRNTGVGDVITTQTFLSTTIQEVVAIKYAFNNEKTADKQIVWKIIVDEDMLDIFNYTFLGEPFNIHDGLEKLFADSNIECEFLLNMGALLRCVDINVIYDFQGYYIKGYNIPKKEYTQYTFKFIGWNLDYTERINSSMSKYITYLGAKRETT